MVSLIYFSVAISFAQQYTNYSTKDGLPSNHIYTITQDAKGFVWFLTDKGLSRYNGNQLKTFTTKNGLPNNDVWDAFPTPDGKIWYLSKSASLGYIENDTVLSFPNNNKDQIINPIYSSQIGDSIFPTGTKKTFSLKDNKWVGELNRVVEVLGEDWVKIRHKKVGYLVFTKKDEKLYLYTKDLKKERSILTKNIYGVTGARGQINDSLFFWTSNKNYSILNLNTQQLKQFDLKENLGNSLTTYPRINLVNNVLQISGSSFVAHLDKNLEIVDPFFFPENIQAHFGFIDKLNTIWLATFNNGVYKLPYVKKEIKYKLQNEKIQSFNVIDGNLIVGVYKKGFYKYNTKEKSFENFINNNDYVFGASEIKPLNTNFYSLKNTLLKEVNKKIETIKLTVFYQQDIAMNEVARKVVYFNNKFYGNFSFGINRLSPDHFVIEKEYTQRGCNDIINFKNRLLIATTNGLKEIKKDTLLPVNFKTNDFKKSILNLTKIDDTHLLINTDGFGSYITDLKTIKPLHLTEYLIVEEAFVENNTLWLATNSGVIKFKKDNDVFQFEKRFTISDGLPTNHINTLYVDDTNLIVGTNNGVAILPKNQISKPQLLDIYIENAKYNKEDITATISAFKYQENNNVNFTVSNIDFSENHSNFSYDYKLEPIQKEWISSKINSFNFNDLQPGNYTFHVKSNNIKKTLGFSIKPLWWQNRWVRFSAFLLTVFLIVLISRFFVKRSQQQKNQKIIEDKRLSELQLTALRSQMNPHFVFNSLAAIQYYINNNEIEASETYLVKFSKLIRQFFELSKETAISLTEEIKLIKNYLDIEKLRFKDKFEYSFNVDKSINLNTVKLPTMLLQPIVENAINHGVFNKMENGKVTVNINTISDKSIKVEIIDDGVGFVNTQKRNNKKVKSSNVLEDRLKYLNKSGLWKIIYNEEELHPELNDRGNKSTFIITQL
ncbi:histidine kinase [Olleya sp. R77988]|uniref:sensor histidine kinase n=1 Tax=Olleya sp. R77988 TaxID=3093875 RepID=UPI0037C93770